MPAKFQANSLKNLRGVSFEVNFSGDVIEIRVWLCVMCMCVRMCMCVLVCMCMCICVPTQNLSPLHFNQIHPDQLLKDVF